MNNFSIISQILRQPWFIDMNYGQEYLRIADQFLSGNGPQLQEKNISIQLVHQGVTIAKDYENQVPLQETFNDVQPGTVAIIPVNGVMTKYDVCGWYGMQSLAQLVTAAAGQENISAVVLMMDTPGGSADGSLDLAMAVEAAAQVKPVVAYADGLLCSAGYRVACRATSIVAKPGSIIGSIGTQISLRFNDAQLKANGIEEVTITADTSPDKNGDFLQAKIGNYKIIKESMLNPLDAQFKGEVTSARPGIDATALTGSTFTSSAAMSLGLIDSEGMLDDAIQIAQTNIKSINETSMKIPFGQKISNLLGWSDSADQLTEQHAQQLEELATANETAQQTINQQTKTIADQKATIDAIQALFAGKTDLVAAVTEAAQKAADFDKKDGGQQHRLDDSSSKEEGKKDELQQTLDNLPHHQKLSKNPFY